MTPARPLQIEGFGLRYRRTLPWAVRDVSASVPQGSITALVGPNGAGKSTLLRACVGFERPTEGRVLVCGIDPRRDRASAVKLVGYVPQANALYRGLTIRDHFVIARAARRTFDTEYARQRIRAAGLESSRRVDELSGGEAAQVALAIALGTRAPLLVLDEPLATLDPLARRDFLVVLVDHARQSGASVILASHIVTDIELAADRLIVLGHGRLLLSISMEEADQTFGILEASHAGVHSPIATFSGQSGELLALLPEQSRGRPASLEEVVLGHLAVGRSRPIETDVL